MERNSDADAIGLYQGQESVQVLVLPKVFFRYLKLKSALSDFKSYLTILREITR